MSTSDQDDVGWAPIEAVDPSSAPPPQQWGEPQHAPLPPLSPLTPQWGQSQQPPQWGPAPQWGQPGQAPLGPLAAPPSDVARTVRIVVMALFIVVTALSIPVIVAANGPQEVAVPPPTYSPYVPSVPRSTVPTVEVDDQVLCSGLGTVRVRAPGTMERVGPLSITTLPAPAAGRFYTSTSDDDVFRFDVRIVEGLTGLYPSDEEMVRSVVLQLDGHPELVEIPMITTLGMAARASFTEHGTGQLMRGEALAAKGTVVLVSVTIEDPITPDMQIDKQHKLELNRLLASFELPALVMPPSVVPTTTPPAC